MTGNDKKRYVEKVTYVGDLRLIGLVYNGLSKTPMGYLVFVERTNTTRTVTLDVLISMYNRYKFSNIEITGNRHEDIKCTECSIDKLHKFIISNNNYQSIGNNSLYILGQIFDKRNKKLGYRVIASNGKIVDMSVDELNEYMNKDVEISNMHSIGTGAKGLTANKQDLTIKIVREEVKSPKKGTDVGGKAVINKDLNNYGLKVKEENKEKFKIRMFENFFSCLECRPDDPVRQYHLPRGSFLDKKSNLCIERGDVKLASEKLLEFYKLYAYKYCNTDAEKGLFKRHYEIAKSHVGKLIMSDIIFLSQFLVRDNYIAKNIHSWWLHSSDFVRKSSARFCGNNDFIIDDIYSFVANVKVNDSKDFEDYRNYTYKSFDCSSLSELLNLETNYNYADFYAGLVNSRQFSKHSRSKIKDRFNKYKDTLISASNRSFVDENAKCLGDLALAMHYERLVKAVVLIDRLNWGTSSDKYKSKLTIDAACLELLCMVGKVCSPAIYNYYKSKYFDRLNFGDDFSYLDDAIHNINCDGLVIDLNNNRYLYTFYRTGCFRYDDFITKFKSYDYQEMYALQRRRHFIADLRSAFISDIYGALLPFASDNLCNYFDNVLNELKDYNTWYKEPYFTGNEKYAFDLG